MFYAFFFVLVQKTKNIKNRQQSRIKNTKIIDSKDSAQNRVCGLAKGVVKKQVYFWKILWFKNDFVAATGANVHACIQ